MLCVKLGNILSTNGKWTMAVSVKDQRRVLEKVAEGDWLFVMDRPFLSLSRECRVKYGHLMGRRL